MARDIVQLLVRLVMWQASTAVQVYGFIAPRVIIVCSMLARFSPSTMVVVVGLTALVVAAVLVSGEWLR